MIVIIVINFLCRWQKFDSQIKIPLIKQSSIMSFLIKWFYDTFTPASPEPIEYRGFSLAHESLKSTVDAFYDPRSFERDEHEFIQTQIHAANVTPLDSDLETLYQQSDLWQDYQSHNYSDRVIQWAGNLASLMVKLIAHQLKTMDTLVTVHDRVQYMQNEISRVEIQYSKIFTHHMMGLDNGQLLQTMLLKQMEFITVTGMPSSVLTLAHYLPELVCHEIHPIINRNGCAHGTPDQIRELAQSPVYGTLYTQFHDFL